MSKQKVHEVEIKKGRCRRKRTKQTCRKRKTLRRGHSFLPIPEPLGLIPLLRRESYNSIFFKETTWLEQRGLIKHWINITSLAWFTNTLNYLSHHMLWHPFFIKCMDSVKEFLTTYHVLGICCMPEYSALNLNLVLLKLCVCFSGRWTRGWEPHRSGRGVTEIFRKIECSSSG